MTNTNAPPMKPPFPRSLFARLMLIWLIGMALVLAASFALFVGERERAGRDALYEGIAQEIAATVAILDGLPPAERDSRIDELSRRRLRLSLRQAPHNLPPQPSDHALRQALVAALPGNPVELRTMRPPGANHSMFLVTILLSDGTPLTVRLPDIGPSPPPPTPPDRLLAALVPLVIGVALLTWIAVRIATKPLSRMAAAARALGENPGGAPMDTRGPIEVAQAATAFNHMQQRIGEHIAERTRILAAISHDLQTPITRLRLRAEMVPDDALRERIQGDLDAMQTLVQEGLSYAKSMETTTPPQPIDLNNLIEALRDDAIDMGWQIDIHGSAPTPCPGRPGALRRALWNLIENGVKFGARVDMTLTEWPDRFEIRIRDHGTGLPPNELDKVFQPFYRTEASRNRETGGTGLGLAIARNLLHAQGGEVTLSNHAEGGLEAVVTMPNTLPG